MATITEVLDRVGVTAPDDILADIDVPVLTGPQRQGDVGIFPCRATHPATGTMTGIPPAGVTVVRGEANTHMLLPEAGDTVRWWPAPESEGSVLLGVLEVPDGATAWLVHTDEHGVNGIGPGVYVLNGKREQADEIRRVAD